MKPRATLQCGPTAAIYSVDVDLWIQTYKLAFHGADTDTDTDSPNTATVLRPIRAISSRGSSRGNSVCVGRKTVAVFGESVSVSVSAPWNASYTEPVPLKYGKLETK